MPVPASTPHLDPLRAELRALQQEAPAQPWRHIGTFAVGGLRAAGFADASDLLLVVSSMGRGVFDCRAGTKLARNDDEYWGEDLDLLAEGIGPLAGQSIPMAGPYGGGLRRLTADGWSLELVTLAWPAQDILLLAPFSSLYDCLHGKPSRFQKIDSESELRAVGFSPTGRSLVIASSSTLTIYGRDS
jgi:hypothetical protein